MSHQVNFYVDPADTVVLEHAIRTLGPMAILHSRSASAEPRVLESVGVEENGQPWLFFHLARLEDIPFVVTRHVQAQGYWTVDVSKSPVIEFNRCFFDGKILRRGRLYYVDGFYDASREWHEKALDFRQWAKAALSKAKKTLKKHETDYIGSSAAAWLTSSGGRLVT